MFALTPVELEALRISLVVALASLVISLPPAIALAALFARRSFPGKTLLNALVHLPLVLPPVVTGYVLLLLLGRKGLIGAWLESTFGLVLAFKWTGAAVAAAVMAFPLMLRPIRLSMEAIDPRLEAAAGTLGANPLWSFATITLPLAAPGVVTAMILGFARSLGEFGATIIFVSNIPGETRTIAMAIFAFLQIPGSELAVFRLSLIAIVVSVLALVGSEVFARNLYRRLRGHDVRD
ncbi:MAG: molybdate ABC transporter permease subunit [Alphaproteobacteria bacterium]